MTIASSVVKVFRGKRLISNLMMSIGLLLFFTSMTHATSVEVNLYGYYNEDYDLFDDGYRGFFDYFETNHISFPELPGVSFNVKTKMEPGPHVLSSTLTGTESFSIAINQPGVKKVYVLGTGTYLASNFGHKLLWCDDINHFSFTLNYSDGSSVELFPTNILSGLQRWSDILHGYMYGYNGVAVGHFPASDWGHYHLYEIPVDSNKTLATITMNDKAGGTPGINPVGDYTILALSLSLSQAETCPETIDNAFVHIHLNHQRGIIDTLRFKQGSGNDLLDQYWNGAVGLGCIGLESGSELVDCGVYEDSAWFEYVNADYGSKTLSLYWSTDSGFEMRVDYDIVDTFFTEAKWEPGGDNNYGSDYVRILNSGCNYEECYIHYPGPWTLLWQGYAYGAGVYDNRFDEAFGYRFTYADSLRIATGASLDGPFWILPAGQGSYEFSVKDTASLWDWLMETCSGSEAIVDCSPDPIYVYWAYAMDPMTDTVFIGDFAGGYTAADVDAGSLLLNGSISPTGTEIFDAVPGFDGQVLAAYFSMSDFIMSYPPLLDTTEQEYTVTGQLTDAGTFEATGLVTMIGKIQGDLNCDMKVNMLDIAVLTGYIFRGGQSPRPVEAGDVDESGYIDIDDVVCLVNYVFLGTPFPAQNHNDADRVSKSFSGSAKVQINRLSNDMPNSYVINVSSDTEIQGIQIEIGSDNPDAIDVTNLVEGMELLSGSVEGNFRIGLVDLNGKYILPAGAKDVVRIQISSGTDIHLNDVILVKSGGGKIDVQFKKSTSEPIAPMSYALHQNYPNPFNPTTTISFDMINPGDYSLTIYNLMGQVVDKITGTASMAGTVSVEWNALDKASGVYFYRLEAGNFTQTKKMMLMK